VRRNNSYTAALTLGTLLLLLFSVVSSSITAGIFPSVISTFLATLKIMPMDAQVNKNELQPILTNGNVTPVTGTIFTLTAILAMACITNVKLNPNARKAPNA
jgi:hypothetical protein